MERIRIAIIGGGAAGLFLANAVKDGTGVLLLERGERLGRKLSATGNGQGNVSNLAAREGEYFSVAGGAARAQKIVQAFDERETVKFFERLGVPCIADERGRVYPASRQASSLTDALRFSLQNTGVDARLKSRVTALKKSGKGFLLTVEGEEGAYELFAERVVLCAGGRAAKNFGTDGSAYALATSLGHTVTPLYPSLVQLKTQTKHIKTLKGIRVTDGVVRIKTPTRAASVKGDIIFTDYGVSGDTVFRLSAFVTQEAEKGGCTLSIDFLPEKSKEELLSLLQAKAERYPALDKEELLFGIVNNQIGRAIMRRAAGDFTKAAALVKDFSLEILGSLGFDYAQVTKGGIPLAEVTYGLESKLAEGLYFAGEMLDVDGQCGGFNLQWAFSSAMTVADGLRKAE